MNTIKTNLLPSIWENPEIQEVNRLPMRSLLLPFCSAEKALEDAIAGPEFRQPEQNEYYLNLSGSWRFKLLNNPAEDFSPNAVIGGLDVMNIILYGLAVATIVSGSINYIVFFSLMGACIFVVLVKEILEFYYRKKF